MGLTGDQRERLTRRASGQLREGETVLDVSIGALHLPHERRRDRMVARAMSVLVTDRRLVFFRRGWRGHEVHSLGYAQIQAVDHRKGALVGELFLTIAGSDDVRVSSIPADDVERLATLIQRCSVGGTPSG